MKTRAGIWIDHRRAVIVFLTEDGQRVQEVSSEIDKYFRPSDSHGSYNIYGRYDFPAYDIVKRDFEDHLRNFYNRVAGFLRDSREIMIFGPGMAKIDMRKALEKHRLGAQIVDIEAAEKMSENRIVEKVKRYFSPAKVGAAR
jgi:hypothetical protein